MQVKRPLRAPVSWVVAAVGFVSFAIGGCQSAQTPMHPEGVADLFVLSAPQPEDWDDDGKPDGITVKVITVSSEGKFIKTEGEVVFHLYEGTHRDGDLPPLPHKTWKAKGKQLEAHWKEGALPGYVFRLNWGELPLKGSAAVLEVVLKPEAGPSRSCRLVISLW